MLSYASSYSIVNIPECIPQFEQISNLYSIPLHNGYLLASAAQGCVLEPLLVIAFFDARFGRSFFVQSLKYVSRLQWTGTTSSVSAHCSSTISNCTSALCCEYIQYPDGYNFRYSSIKPFKNWLSLFEAPSTSSDGQLDKPTTSKQDEKIEQGIKKVEAMKSEQKWTFCKHFLKWIRNFRSLHELFKQFRPNVPNYDAGTIPATTGYVPSHFMRGTMIKLANGKMKRVWEWFRNNL